MKTMRIPSVVFLAGFLTLVAGVVDAQSIVKYENDVYGYPIGRPIAFTQEIDCIHSDPHATDIWDFGSGATPATALTPFIFDGMSASCTAVVTYSIAGVKTVGITCPGCADTSRFQIHIYDCSSPSIPHDAIVINSDTTIYGSGKTYWVNSGFTGSFLRDTIFAEPGSSISGVGCVIYLKHGTVCNAGGQNSVIFGDGASINARSNDFTFSCPTLDFDYTNAPPNSAHLSGVPSDIGSAPIAVFPNPTSGSVSINGLPATALNISVVNLLGETVLEQKNVHRAEFSLALSKLAPGAYYIRIASAHSVVTKEIIKN